MADLSTIPEDVVYARDRTNAADDMNDIWAAIVELKQAMQYGHTDAGRNRFLHYATFEWTGSKFSPTDQSQAGLFADCTPTSTGVLDLVFTASMADRNYGVQLTGGIDADGRPGQIGYDADDIVYKTAAGLRVLMTKNSATTVANLNGFTIIVLGELA